MSLYRSRLFGYAFLSILLAVLLIALNPMLAQGRLYPPVWYASLDGDGDADYAVSEGPAGDISDHVDRPTSPRDTATAVPKSALEGRVDFTPDRERVPGEGLRVWLESLLSLYVLR